MVSQSSERVLDRVGRGADEWVGPRKLEGDEEIQNGRSRESKRRTTAWFHGKQ